MKLNTSLARLAFGLTAAASVTSAWPAWLPQLESLIVVRQENGDGGNAGGDAGGNGGNGGNGGGDGGNAGGNPITPAPNGNRPTQVDLNTAVINTDSTAPTQTTKSNSTKHEEFDPLNPVGNIVMITPAPIAATPALYKIGDFVTWGWNYTNVLADPTAIDLILSCTLGPRSWTLTGNMTFQTIGSYTWDSSVQESDVSDPLLTEQYTLIIKDSDVDIDDAPQPGYLSPNSGFSFAMYKGKDYTPLADWNCATCSAATHSNGGTALAFAAMMSLISVLSFTWFVNGLNL